VAYDSFESAETWRHTPSPLGEKVPDHPHDPRHMRDGAIGAEDKRAGWQCHAVMGDSKRIGFLVENHADSWTVSKGKKVE